MAGVGCTLRWHLPEEWEVAEVGAEVLQAGRMGLIADAQELPPGCSAFGGPRGGAQGN